MQIIWSPVAEETYAEILKQIIKKWSIEEAVDFDTKVEHLLYNLKEFKNLCPPSKKEPALRRCTITEQTGMVYKVIDKKTIEIVTFILHRSSPEY